MMRFSDFSAWQGIFTALLSLTLITLIGVGIRVMMMLTPQAHQQRMNRQINKRLKARIAAHLVLGGSVTGNLTVNPAPLRDLRLRDLPDGPLAEPGSAATADTPGADRSRRIPAQRHPGCAGP